MYFLCHSEPTISKTIGSRCESGNEKTGCEICFAYPKKTIDQSHCLTAREPHVFVGN